MDHRRIKKNKNNRHLMEKQVDEHGLFVMGWTAHVLEYGINFMMINVDRKQKIQYIINK